MADENTAHSASRWWHIQGPDGYDSWTDDPAQAAGAEAAGLSVVSGRRFKPHQWNYEQAGFLTPFPARLWAYEDREGGWCLTADDRVAAAAERGGLRMEEYVSADFLEALVSVVDARNLNETRSHRENETEHQKQMYDAAEVLLKPERAT